MFKRKQKVVDERIEKESNKLSARMYVLMLVLTNACLIFKITKGLPFYLYALEIIIELTMILYFLVKESQSGILFMNKRDEATQTLHEAVLAKAFNLAFNIVVEGEFLLMFGLLIWAREYFFWVLSYLVIWVPAALLITVLSIKRGWLVWGSKKKEQEGTKAFGKRVVFGSLGYGCFMSVFFMIMTGEISLKLLALIPIMAAMWGIPFYFIMLLFVKKAEKQADKQLEAVEYGSEE
ncbi:MAG: hypothetical protein IKJ39_01545 [Lachnospiraceae bacterium]|nr:hypothetical protein [Lachnospiraceae bacterium]